MTEQIAFQTALSICLRFAIDDATTAEILHEIRELYRDPASQHNDPDPFPTERELRLFIADFLSRNIR